MSTLKELPQRLKYDIWPVIKVLVNSKYKGTPITVKPQSQTWARLYTSVIQVNVQDQYGQIRMGMHLCEHGYL